MHYLIIPQVKPSDAGEVVVVARNIEGEIQASASLDVFLQADFRQHRLKPTQRGKKCSENFFRCFYLSDFFFSRRFVFYFCL